MNTTTFADELQQLRTQYSTEEARTEWSNAYNASQVVNATQYFLETLLGNEDAWSKFRENAINTVKAKDGKSVALLTWQGYRGPVNNGKYLADLLDLGDLLPKLQDVIDHKGGEGKFIVYKDEVSYFKGRRSYSLLVSWNDELFEQLKEKIVESHDKAEKHAEKVQSRREEGLPDNSNTGEDNHGYENRNGSGNRRPSRQNYNGRHNGGERKEDYHGYENRNGPGSTRPQRQNYNNGDRNGGEYNKRQGGERNQYGGESSQYGGERSQYGGERNQYGGERNQYGGERSQYGGERNQYGGERNQYGGQRNQQGGQRNQQGGQRNQQGGQHNNTTRGERKPRRAVSYNSEPVVEVEALQ